MKLKEIVIKFCIKMLFCCKIITLDRCYSRDLIGTMSMSFELPQSALEQLKGFIMLCRTKPEILNKEELTFFREYLTSLGARLPPTPEPAQKERKPEPKPAAAPEEPAPTEEVRS
jgi:hypothetical protein